MLKSILLLALVTFIVCLFITPILRAIALSIGLTDKPSNRKRHNGEVPLIGGIAIFVAGTIALFFQDQPFVILQFCLLATPLIVIGILDDLYDVHFSLRLVVQILVSVGMIYLSGLQIHQIGDIYGQGTIELGVFLSPIFTVFCVIGVINAINMLDGSDGLAGVITLITVLALTYVAYGQGDIRSLTVGAFLIGGLVAFLLYNTHVFGSANHVFLGDTGSMFLGFALVWLFIGLSQQGDQATRLSPVAAGWIFGLPLVDVISVLVGRIRKGMSPFSAGRDHLHHLLLDRGFSIKTTVLSLALIQSVFVGLGLLINEFSQIEPFAFWLFVLLVIVHHFKTESMLNSRKKSQIVLS